MAQNPKILWADDEIDLLKPQILFLEKKGFSVLGVTNGQDAIDSLEKQEFDLVFLDENMPGMNGLETLNKIKALNPSIPVIMITKSEEEHIMEDAIGSKIADYLIKPVNPNQILLACKKILDGKSLVSQKANEGYQKDFSKIGMAFFDEQTPEQWIDLYKKILFWELELDKSEDKSMVEIFNDQKAEANSNFSKFYTKNYLKWVKTTPENRPHLSPDILPERVFPHLKNGEKVFLMVVDCMRFDQWKTFFPIVNEYFNIDKEDAYFSILPTATQYARNALFAGMFPLEISQKFPKMWVGDEDEGGKNLHEADFLKELIAKQKLNIKWSYTKVITPEDGKNLVDNLSNLYHNDFNVLVFNFIDILSHARSEMNIIRELVPNEAALRSLSKSWIEFSSFLTVLKKLKDKDYKVILTTDHGTIRVNRPLKIIGDRTTTTNLRYKQGKNLSFDEKSKFIFSIKNPEDAKLPKMGLSATYAFGIEDSYFCYPNNYNYYVTFFKDSFQHGGVSIEEVIVPYIEMSPKK